MGVGCRVVCEAGFRGGLRAPWSKYIDTHKHTHINVWVSTYVHKQYSTKGEWGGGPRGFHTETGSGKFRLLIRHVDLSAIKSDFDFYNKSGDFIVHTYPFCGL